MPTYQYRCSDCGVEFDRYQKFSDEPLTVCPTCEGSIRRVIQPVGVVFKGAGWYINDSRPSASPKNGADGKTEKSESTEKSDATVEAKVDKSESKEAPASKPSEPAKPAEKSKSSESKVPAGT